MGKKSLRKANKLQKKATVTARATAAIYVPPKVLRPFADFANEAQLVLMRELLPAATLKMRTTSAYGSKEVLICTIAPELAQAAVLKDGKILVSMQNSTRSNDASHDLAVVLEQALKAAPGTVIKGVDVRCRAPKLSEILQTEGGDFQLHDSLEYWLSEEDYKNSQITEAISQASESLVPVVDLDIDHQVFWFKMGTEQFLRWAIVIDEDRGFDALARLKANSQLEWGNADFIGVFRGLGVIIPVWRLRENIEKNQVSGLKGQAENFAKLLGEALAKEDSLTAAERQDRRGIVSRLVSLN